jgi:hypothetical protein
MRGDGCWFVGIGFEKEARDEVKNRKGYHEEK